MITKSAWPLPAVGLLCRQWVFDRRGLSWKWYFEAPPKIHIYCQCPKDMWHCSSRPRYPQSHRMHFREEKVLLLNCAGGATVTCWGRLWDKMPGPRPLQRNLSRYSSPPLLAASCLPLPLLTQIRLHVHAELTAVPRRDATPQVVQDLCSLRGCIPGAPAVLSPPWGWRGCGGTPL